MLKLHLIFPKNETLSNVLSWNHYFEILRSNNELEINFAVSGVAGSYVNSGSISWGSVGWGAVAGSVGGSTRIAGRLGRLFR